MRWRIVICEVGIEDDKLEAYLKDGWEPFFVTEISMNYKIWLRKQVEDV